MNRLGTNLLRLTIGASLFAPRIGLASCMPSSGPQSEQAAGLSAVDGTSSNVCAQTGAGTLSGKIGTVIDTLFIVAGAVAVIILIIGGIRYITSTGDSKRIQAAKDTILYAVIGLVVVIVARAIVGFVIGQIGT